MAKKRSQKNLKGKNKFLNGLFYALIGVTSSLGLFALFYWSLRLNASIDNLIRNFYGTPLYFWPYVFLTIGTIILFGINVPLLIYRWRKYGFPKLRNHAGTGAGSIIGILASACPVCGSTLLSAIGVAGGLTAFPLQGLELKALSLGFMVFPIAITTSELKKFAKGGKECPIPKDPSFKKHDWPILLFLIFQIFALGSISWTMLKTDPAVVKVLASSNIINQQDNRFNTVPNTSSGSKEYNEVVAKVLPKKGFQSKIFLAASVVKLVESGVIDKKKVAKLYKDRGGLPVEFKNVLTQPSFEPILLTKENANNYVNLLWAVGLSNYMSTNKKSPIVGKDLFNFASTGGWTLGKEKNGGKYFNKFKIVPLTQEQEGLVTKVAQNTYRPCCDSSTFFQDCNHGSALLGLLQLGASQGLTERELYREALAFNSFWFPHNYIQTALYFKVVKNTDWEDVDPKLVLGKQYSASSGWSKNVAQEIAKIPNLLLRQEGGGSCGV